MTYNLFVSCLKVQDIYRMPSNVKKYAHHLKVMGNATPSMCKAMVKSADAGLVRCLCECALNILKGNVPLSTLQKRRLARHKKELRCIANRKTSIATKKKVLQRGGFIAALAGPILKAVVPSLLGGILSS